jgi:hypothetical protein
MRTTIALDDELAKQAEYYTGIKEKAALVNPHWLESGFFS